MSKVSSPSTPRKKEDTPKPTQPLSVSPNGKAASPAPTSSKVSVPASPPASPAAKRAVSEAPSTHPDVEEEDEDEAADSDIIDLDTFQQILELDEDDTHEFSSEMVWQYFGQASTTFDQMDEAFKAKDLLKLSDLGHFLKGSSAALGVRKVQATCEKIQHYGKKRDDESGKDLSEKEALEKIEPLLKLGKKEYIDAEKWLRAYYKERGVTGPPEAD